MPVYKEIKINAFLNPEIILVKKDEVKEEKSENDKSNED